MEQDWADRATRIRALADLLGKQGFAPIEDQLQDLSSRLESGREDLHVAFCGLFSAGKSSLLNALCERTDLLTGAVPTTAIVTEVPLPTGGVACLDTPGIDSTDASHQAATQDALNKSDAVVLVMDYQQVESDANLRMAQLLTDKGIRLYLVVNQVDKHMEWEIPFTTYQSRVEQTFDDWGIAYEAIFYTSTRRHPDAGLAALQRALMQLPKTMDVLAGVMRAVQGLVEDAVNQLHAVDCQQTDAACHDVIGNVPYAVSEGAMWLADTEGRMNDVLTAAADGIGVVRTEQQEWIGAVVRMIDLVQIAPYETTELGRKYVESLRSDFKVGWFRAAAQTNQARQQRLAAFVLELRDKTEKFLVWPVQTLMRETMERLDWAEAGWLGAVDSIGVEVTAELCSQQVKQGALVSEQYPYQYVKDVVQVIKATVRGRTTRCIDGWAQQAGLLREQIARELPEYVQAERRATVLRAWLDVRTSIRETVVDWMLPMAQPAQAVAEFGGGHHG